MSRSNGKTAKNALMEEIKFGLFGINPRINCSTSCVMPLGFCKITGGNISAALPEIPAWTNLTVLSIKLYEVVNNKMIDTPKVIRFSKFATTDLLLKPFPTEFKNIEAIPKEA